MPCRRRSGTGRRPLARQPSKEATTMTTSAQQNQLAALFKAATVIPVLTIERIQDAVPLARALIAGGIKGLRALGGPFPNVRFCPTGGVGEANAATWLAEPNVVAVGGSWLCPTAEIRAGNWAGITAICQRTLKALKAT